MLAQLKTVVVIKEAIKLACLHCISDQFDVILIGQKKHAFLSKTRTFLSDPKILNGSW
jgi:hypothetical protein